MALQKLGFRLLVGLVVVAALSGCRGAPPWRAQGQLIVLDRGASGDPTATIVYLERESESRWTPWRQTLIEVTSDGASFRPPLTAVYVGDRVRFVNRGTVVHRIFTTDTQSRHDRLVEPGGRSSALRISQIGANRFYCSLHPDESFVIFASPSPFFLVLDGEPSLRIDRIPAGSYRLSSWSEGGVRFLAAIEIRSGEATSHSVSSTPTR